MKNILGLDLGTNSIGWALVQTDDEGNYTSQIKIGSRIIPMTQDVLGKFDSGVTESAARERTEYRGVRRLRERCLQRRERLLRVLHVLDFLPEHYSSHIGWDSTSNATYGKFLDESEPKIAWKRNKEGKMEFIFMDSFQEMLNDFSIHQPALVADGKKIPLDWTLYYLRKKALSKPIRKEELAWILLSFNQKRGYYQLRGEEEEEKKENRLEEYFKLKVIRVEATDEKRGDNVWYNVHLENGWIYRRASRLPLNDWEGKVREFIVTTDLEKDGTPKMNKDGEVKRSFRSPKDDDWGLQKIRTERDIDASNKTVGEYIYDSILSHPSQKVRGRLVRTIERKFYKDELRAIISKQAEFISELSDSVMLEKCINELYPKNEGHQSSLFRHDMSYFLIDDLLFYQRPLKSKKSLISDCPMENYEYVDRNTGEIKIQAIKCAAKSNPFFQEFRIWQFIQNLRLIDRSGFQETDITSKYISTEDDYVRLFHWLNDQEKVTQNKLLGDYFKIKKPKGKDASYPLRWNYVEDKDYPCNETRYDMLQAIEKAGLCPALISKREDEYRLWHLLYSVNDKNELQKALESYANSGGRNLPESFVREFLKIKPFEKEYASFSEKAIKRLLSLMRYGSMWNEEAIDDKTKERIRNILAGHLEPSISERISHAGFHFEKIEDFRGLPLWIASYIVYGRHAESRDTDKWNTPHEMMSYIRSFRQHSLRNPVVEQCILETLRAVHDLWKEVDHIDEIHVEMGRSMKSTVDQRRRMTEQVIRNENTNLRIRQLLQELKNDDNIKDVRPYSPMQQDILRIYEEGALSTLKKDDEDYAEITRISRLASPTQSEMLRYKLWLEQKYCSPYTGRPISLAKLFTTAYQIEHVIPKARFFDDSFSNKVICEAEVNQLKSNLLGYEFIKKNGGQIVHCPTLGDVSILKEDEYKAFIADNYSSNPNKKRKLLMDDIPEEFIQRQMNDTRYISRFILALLSNVVRDEDEKEYTSKHVIPCTGGITDRLKKDWGLNDVWNHIVAPRFQRMNDLTHSDLFGHWEDKNGKRVFQTDMPLELRRGFSKKRIDHRHHAMDALAIACASRQIISYLNNENAQDTERRYDLRAKLCGKNQLLLKPWDTFTQDAEAALQNIVVSFKNYVRVINKASNYYRHYDESGRKVMVAQTANDQWAVRKPLHKETVFGHVNLKRKKEVPLAKALENPDVIADKNLRKAIQGMLAAGMTTKKVLQHFKDILFSFEGKNIQKVEVFYFTDDTEVMVATRKPLDETFDEKRIKDITDTGIQKILFNYLQSKGGDPKVAFSPEGIQQMNEQIALYNKGKNHQPILRVRVSEPRGEKFQVGQTGNKTRKYVEAQKGTNLYFAIYLDTEGNRSYSTIPLNIVVERLKQGLSPVPETDEKGNRLLFYLSPNDLVYVPTEEERENPDISIDKNRIYKMVSATGNECLFIKSSVASPIVNKQEFGPLNKVGRSIENDCPMIKNVCWKIVVDRLGNIIKVIR